MTKIHVESVKKGPSSEWLERVTTDVQKALGSTVLGSIEDSHASLLRVGQTLPAPRTPAERLVMRGMLLELACRTGARIHALVHHRQRHVSCRFPDYELLHEFFTERSSDPRRAFLLWTRSFFAELHRSHPPTPARKVSLVIRRDYQRPLDVSRLAHQFHMSPSQLRRAFRREFGMTILDYGARVRLLAALEQVPREKTDVTALLVGYTRTKTFRRWFKNLTGFTPTGFRRLSDDRRCHIVDLARMALHLGARN